MGDTDPYRLERFVAAQDILGPVDAMKLRSSVTLFRAVAGPGEPWAAFSEVPETFFGGLADEATLALVSSGPQESCY